MLQYTTAIALNSCRTTTSFSFNVGQRGTLCRWQDRRQYVDQMLSVIAASAADDADDADDACCC